MSQKRKPLSRVASIIVYRLLDHRKELINLTCPVTRLIIEPNTKPEEVKEMFGYSWTPEHYFWMGFYYIHTKDETGLSIVDIYDESGVNVGYAESTKEFFEIGN